MNEYIVLTNKAFIHLVWPDYRLISTRFQWWLVGLLSPTYAHSPLAEEIVGICEHLTDLRAVTSPQALSLAQILKPCFTTSHFALSSGLICQQVGVCNGLRASQDMNIVVAEVKEAWVVLGALVDNSVVCIIRIKHLIECIVDHEVALVCHNSAWCRAERVWLDTIGPRL